MKPLLIFCAFPYIDDRPPKNPTLIFFKLKRMVFFPYSIPYLVITLRLLLQPITSISIFKTFSGRMMGGKDLWNCFASRNFLRSKNLIKICVCNTYIISNSKNYWNFCLENQHWSKLTQIFVRSIWPGRLYHIFNMCFLLFLTLQGIPHLWLNLN